MAAEAASSCRRMFLGKLRAIHELLKFAALSAVMVGPKEDGEDDGDMEKKLWNLELELAVGGGGCGACWGVSVAALRGILREQSILHSGHDADLIVNQGSNSY
jgi:hypothetical protein